MAGGPQPNAVKAHPQAKILFTRMLNSGSIKPGHRATQFYEEITGREIAKDKFRKFFDASLKKLQGEESVRAAQNKGIESKTCITLLAKFFLTSLSSCSDNQKNNPQIVGIDDEDDVNDVDMGFIVDEDEMKTDNLRNYGADQIQDRNVWWPLFLISVYKDIESRDDRCAAAILLPSRVHEYPDGIKVEIEGSSTLRITIAQSPTLTDTRTMLSNFLEGVGVAKMDRCDPMIGGFHDALRALQPDREGKRESVAHIPLPFAVKPNPPKWLCAYEGSATKILIVKMEGPTTSFAKLNTLTSLTAARVPEKTRDAASETA